MSGIEHRLGALREEVAFPETPDLARWAEESAVRARGAHARPRWRPLAVALAVALAAAGAALALSPGARSAFLELFRLKGATVTRVERLPQVEPVNLNLGGRVSREEAERRVGFRLLDLGEPDAIFVRDGIASLVYGPERRPRLVLSQLRASVWRGLVKKAAAAGTRVEEVEVDGERGLFLSGDEHYVLFFRDGHVDEERTALAGNVLLWNRGELLLRLEADVGRDEALELARSVR